MPSGPRPDPPSGIARLSFEGECEGHPWTNVFYAAYTHSGTVTVADLDAIGILALTRFGTMILETVVGNAVNVLHTVFYSGAGSDPIESYVSSPFSGAVAGEAAPVNTAVLVDWAIRIHYRGGHPRSYFCGVPVSSIQNASDLKSAPLASWQSRINTFFSAFNAMSAGGVTAVSLGTVSFVSAGAWRTPPVFRVYHNGVVQGELATQRRRLRSSAH